MRKLSLSSIGAFTVAAGVVVIMAGDTPRGQGAAPATAVAALEKEVHLANVRQLTFGGENAEAYFSFDGTRLIFQSTSGARRAATRSSR